MDSKKAVKLFAVTSGTMFSILSLVEAAKFIHKIRNRRANKESEDVVHQNNAQVSKKSSSNEIGNNVKQEDKNIADGFEEQNVELIEQDDSCRTCFDEGFTSKSSTLSSQISSSTDELFSLFNNIQHQSMRNSEKTYFINRDDLKEIDDSLKHWQEIDQADVEEAIHRLANAVAFSDSSVDFWVFSTKLMDIFKAQNAQDMTRIAILRCFVNLSILLSEAKVEDELRLCWLLYSCEKCEKFQRLRKYTTLIRNNIYQFYADKTSSNLNDWILNNDTGSTSLEIVTWYDDAIVSRRDFPSIDNFTPGRCDN